MAVSSGCIYTVVLTCKKPRLNYCSTGASYIFIACESYAFDFFVPTLAKPIQANATATLPTATQGELA